MKHYFLLSISILFFNLLSAQNYQLSLGTNYIHIDNINVSNTKNGIGTTIFKQIYIEPFVGFHFKLNGEKNTWFGVEFGRFGNTVTRHSKIQYINDTINTNIEASYIDATYKIKSSYLSFHLNQYFDFKSYKLNIGLVLPFRYFAPREDNYTNYSILASSHIKDYETYQYYLNPKILQYGLWCNQSINKRIYKNLYIGVSIIEKIEIEKHFGTEKYLTWNISQGVETYRNGYEVNNKKFSTSNFFIAPSFKISYFF